MKKIFIDCSYLCEHVELNTGIQRVVRRVVENFKNISKKENLEIIPVNIANGNLSKINIEDLYKRVEDNKIVLEEKLTLKKYLKGVYKSLRDLLVAILPFNFLINFLYQPRERFGLSFLIDRIFLRPIKKIVYRKKNITTTDSIDLQISKGDILLLLDSTWYLNIWPTVKKFKDNNANVIAVTYDLIPITHSQFCDDFLVKVFKEWFFDSLNYVDGFISISNTVKIDLVNFLQKEFDKDITKKKSFDYFLLGSDFEYEHNNLIDVREELKITFKDKITYLIVCTIEPRKNHEYLLNAFEKIWEENIDINLCIVGRIGWKVDELMSRINNHKYKNEKLFHWFNLNDEELRYCYENSKMLIFPSIVEGFGLPIVESLTNKLPVLASDTPIHREVGQDKVEYFDLNDVNDLSNKIINIEKNGIPDRLKISKDFKWKDWNESTNELYSKIKIMVN